MKALFYWPDCTRQFVLENGDVGCLNKQGSPRTVFWVGASRQEVEEHLEDRMVNFNIAFRKILLDQELIEEIYTFKGIFYFIVPTIKRLTDPAIPWPRVFPYSSIWNGGRPWLPIGPPGLEPPHEPKGVGIHSLDDLVDLAAWIRNRAYLEFGPPKP